MEMEFKYYQDPGHGWVEVSADLLKKHNIVDKISQFSYYDDDSKMAYLEEDCDVDVLCQALKKAGIQYKFKSIHVNLSPIRNMNAFYPQRL
jgi:hypothetical protein